MFFRTYRSTVLVSLIIVLLATARTDCYSADLPKPTVKPLSVAVDLNVGESQEVTLSDGKKATVKLVGLDETRDTVCDAVREARVKVEVNGQAVTLVSATYHLPVTVGDVQIDCTITRGYSKNSNSDPWGLDKDARLRLWPAGSPWIQPGTFAYPAKQRWFASDTQMSNDPVYVDGGERPGPRKVYYHWGLDIGGAEGMVEVVSATDGLVVSAGTEALPEYGEGSDTPVRARYDVIYILDNRGWFYRYSHLYSFDPAVKAGVRVKMGQKIGTLGKEGGSGGWSHLHFDITARQPSGKWGTEEGYAFLWGAYLREYSPKIIAVARPHHLAWTGEKVRLDGSRSWGASGKISRYEWTFGDGTKASGPVVERVYDKPGSYREILKVTDDKGNFAYDFAAVQVLDKTNPKQLPPTIHAVYYPTLGIKAGDPVTFKVRTFRTTYGNETWDFGDGTPPVSVKSDGNVKPLAKDGFAVTTHSFAKPGDYLVSVERSNELGMKAIGRLHVNVEPKQSAAKTRKQPQKKK
ncbi:PKD domain-containing protein [Candidatus Sumerlaeota bacterium]|nr:PKD domain-containing protein [Candidatus Sumerlaeota bacterium]